MLTHEHHRRLALSGDVRCAGRASLCGGPLLALRCETATVRAECGRVLNRRLMSNQGPAVASDSTTSRRTTR